MSKNFQHTYHQQLCLYSHFFLGVAVLCLVDPLFLNKKLNNLINVLKGRTKMRSEFAIMISNLKERTHVLFMTAGQRKALYQFNLYTPQNSYSNAFGEWGLCSLKVRELVTIKMENIWFIDLDAVNGVWKELHVLIFKIFQRIPTTRCFLIKFSLNRSCVVVNICWNVIIIGRHGWIIYIIVVILLNLGGQKHCWISVGLLGKVYMEGVNSICCWPAQTSLFKQVNRESQNFEIYLSIGMNKLLIFRLNR